MEPVDRQPEASMDKNQPYGQSKHANRVGMFEQNRRRPSMAAMILGILAVLMLVVVLMAWLF